MEEWLTYYGYKCNQTVLNKLYWYGQLSYEPDFKYYEPRFENVNQEIHGLRHFRDKYGKKMRVRNRKRGDRIAEAVPSMWSSVMTKGKWRDLFGNDNPIHVEVGSGKGAFVSGMAKQNRHH